MRFFRRAGIVGDHHNRLLELLVQAVEQVHDLAGGHLVQVSRRLVGNKDRRVGDDRARDRDTLLLASGKLLRIVVDPVPEAHEVQGGFDVFTLLFSRESRQEERELDILERRQDGKEVVELEYEPDVARPPPGEIRFTQERDVGPVDNHLSRVRAVDSRDQVQDRGFSRPRGTHQRQELACGDVDRNVAEDRDLDAVAPV